MAQYNLAIKEKIRIYILTFLILPVFFSCVGNQDAKGGEGNTVGKTTISELKKLYNIGEYDKCINACKKLIKSEAKTVIENNNPILLAKVYELQAVCLERKGDIDQSVETIQIFLSKLGKFLPKDHVARIKLMIGNIYKGAGL